MDSDNVNTINDNNNKNKVHQIYIFITLDLLVINLYMLIINNFLEKSLTIVDNLIFLTIFMFITIILSYIYVSRKINGNLYNEIKLKLYDFKYLKYLLIVGIPTSICSLVGIIDTSIGIINIIQIILNMFIYYIVKLFKKQINPNNYLYIFCLVLTNGALSVMLASFNDIRFGPLGIIIAVFSSIVSQILNFLLEKNSCIQTTIGDDYIGVFIYSLLFECGYMILITLIGIIIDWNNIDMYFFLKNLYIPFFLSFLQTPYRIEGYGLKNYAQNDFGIIVNICILVSTTITVFITPLFDNSNNSAITYCSIIPLFISIFLNYKIMKLNDKNTEYVNTENIDNPIHESKVDFDDEL